MAWFYAALPVSSGLMAIFALRNLIVNLRRPDGSNASAQGQ
jgi:TRAP-type C4-dicarboxylate transport system permease small subunit